MSAHVAERFEAAGPLPTTSLALEASAGTGKTWTLTALAVRYIAETDITLPEVLLVTFTRAATAELRERVRVRLSETLAAVERALVDPAWTATDDVLERIVGDAARHDDDGEELRRRRDRLRRAAQQLDEATISTIHGFCQQMLQHAALEAGVDFDAVLLDDDADLLAEIVDDHIALQLRPATAAWVRYLQECAGVSRERLTRLAREVASLPSLQLRPAHLDDEDGPCLRPWQDALEDFRTVWTGGGREDVVALIGQLKDDGAFENPKQRTFSANAAQKQAALVDTWLTEDRSLPPGKVDRKKSVHNPPNYPVAYFTATALASKLPDGAAAPHHEVLESATRLVAAASAPATLFLHRAATYIWRELDRRKRQRTVLTFDDLLRRLADALEDDGIGAAVREAIRQRYRVALIDEFQDTDAIQWRIFDALFDTDEPFILIGDPKQAIYAFRGADIHTYVAARDGQPDRRTLQTNHRSDERYVEACNVLFGQPGAFATVDIPYHPIDAHHPDRLTAPGDRAALQLRYIHRDAGELDDRGTGPFWLKKGWADRALPGDVASEVVSLLTDGLTITDGDDPRILVPQDIAVLVRTNRRADAVQQALRDAGVPAVIQRGGSVFATEEAEALQRLLAALLRPGNERLAVTAAASVLFGRDAPTLVAQRDALDREVEEDGPPADHSEAVDATDLARAWDDWADALTRWGQRWHRDGVLPAVRDAFTEDGVAERLLATPEGERRLTNVRHLIELLHTAETSEGLTPNALLDWLQTHRADAADGDQPSTETELRLEEDAQAVRVVTVHGSKGLQYPVVLCPDLWDGRIRVDEALTRFHDPTIPDPREAIALDLDVDTTSEGKRRSIELATKETRTEQLRLAYVALTRAQHRCIVWWGPFKDASTSALASLLHGGLQASAEGRLTRGEDRLAADDVDLVGDLEMLAAVAPRAIGVEVVQTLRHDAKWDPAPRDAPPLRSRTFDRGDVDRAWRRASFTSLVRGASAHDTAAPGAADPASDDGRDVDALPEQDTADLTVAPITPVAPISPADTTGVPLADFPRGAGPGTFIHDVLERADLRAMDDEPTMSELLDAMEQRHGIDPVHRPMVLTGLRAAVATPLGPVAGGVALADLGPGDRLNELRFELPLAGGHVSGVTAVTLDAIADLLSASGDPLLTGYAPRLQDPALRGSVRGFLNGSIDLLARLPNGRFLVADYKSNWLGDRASGRSVVTDYRPDALTAAMYDHHYVLQALLYLVAAHRYLHWRVPDYTYDTHMAGAGYLFLRGMVGPDTPTTDTQPCGIAALRPDGALVADLSRLLDRGRP